MCIRLSLSRKPNKASDLSKDGSCTFVLLFALLNYLSKVCQCHVYFYGDPDVLKIFISSHSLIWLLFHWNILV